MIEDDVVVGAACCIDRAAFRETRIGAGTVLDNLCHIAHNVKIGDDCILTAMLCIAGSSTLGKRVITSGMTGVLDHVTICDDVVLVQRAGVANDIKQPGTYAGTPIAAPQGLHEEPGHRAPPHRHENGGQGAQGPPRRGRSGSQGVKPNPKTSYDKREILAFCVHHPTLPRRLPAPPLLMFDRIPEIHTDGGKHGLGWLVAEKDVRLDEWFFFSHFEGDPVMPGVLEVDAILQLSGFFLQHAGFGGYGRALRTAKTTFREQVRPHHKLVSYRIDFRRISDRPTPLASAEGVALVDGLVSAEVQGIMVGLFPEPAVHVPMTRTVAVTGFGILSPLGRGAAEPPPHCRQAAPGSCRCGRPGPRPACARRSRAMWMLQRCVRTSSASRRASSATPPSSPPRR